jgi:hypothetical protein
MSGLQNGPGHAHAWLRGQGVAMSAAMDVELIALGERFEKLLLEHMDAWLAWAPRMRAAHAEVRDNTAALANWLRNPKAKPVGFLQRSAFIFLRPQSRLLSARLSRMITGRGVLMTLRAL